MQARTEASPAHQSISAHLEDVASLLRAVEPSSVALLLAELERARREDGVVYVCGNGGSAATAMHFCNDLLANSAKRDHAIRTMCLSSNTSTLMALANDTGYENVFVGQLHSLSSRDVVFAISASGNSENCVRAIERARSIGASALSLVGFDGGKLAQRSDLHVHVPRHDYLAVEDVHAAICHAIARSLGHAEQERTA